ncbi:MAG TPA: cyclopropane-fatty-acyl-phospholipid synthase family protein [Caulobacteraceae bacterium]|jgi:cyclopropane-fatty-acyl-phospholipid synthase|nr:cyclopropane-fatty-acyl-phospholipid synthase family protein [Caulobacteraceae bacterium]
MSQIEQTIPLLSPTETRELAAAPAAFRSVIAIARRAWEFGTLTFVLPSGRELRIEGRSPGPDGRLVVKDFRFVSRVLASADIGFGEGYMAGEWDTPDLSVLLEAFTINFDRLETLASGAFCVRAYNALAHALRRNSRNGARRNIHAHYDLGNEFYKRWLDPGMTYSSARFVGPDDTLCDAQRNKYAELARSIDLRREDHVLEIGCGWGGFAEFAAGEIGSKVTAVTISRAQFDFARQRVFAKGLAERAEVKLLDYRDVEGPFDKVASIEMFEAVGEAYWPAYFGKVRDVLSPQGRAGLQIITIKDELFSVYRRRSDFMRKYIFPGGMLPSEARLREEAQRAGLEWGAISRFGDNYARTLAEWGQRFEAAWGEIRTLGFDERFRRLWRFYLSYCEAAFRTGRTDVVQLSLSKA